VEEGRTAIGALRRVKRSYRTAMLSPQDLLARFGSPLYVYDLEVVRARARALSAAISYQPFRPLYAIKANSCPTVARAIIAEGYGIDAVSPGEVALGLRLGLKPDLIQYTENNMTDAEMAEAMRQGVLINCGSLDRLERLAHAGATTACVRFDPAIGAGLHAKTKTAGPLSKFGVHHSLVEDVARIERGSRLRVIGCHMHIGSGSREAGTFVDAMRVLLSLVGSLKNLEFVNFGGGFGIPYREEDQPIDLATLGRDASRLMEEASARYGRRLQMRLEPGRYLVAEAGTLYTTVTSVKRNPDSVEGKGRTYVGCDSGFNHLVRPCMYDAYHRIENVSGAGRPIETVDVVGNICESGDVFGRDRRLPRPELGDILAIRDAGAYGFSMASTYNLRPLPAEVVVDRGDARIARKRQTIEDLLAGWDPV
jgi:diaminopimelate decarboxylase